MVDNILIGCLSNQISLLLQNDNISDNVLNNLFINNEDLHNILLDLEPSHKYTQKIKNFKVSFFNELSLDDKRFFFTNSILSELFNISDLPNQLTVDLFFMLIHTNVQWCNNPNTYLYLNDLKNPWINIIRSSIPKYLFINSEILSKFLHTFNKKALLKLAETLIYDYDIDCLKQKNIIISAIESSRIRPNTGKSYLKAKKHFTKKSNRYSNINI
jgi:hypothetical protein